MPVTDLDLETAALAVDQAAQDVAAAERLPLGASAGVAWAAAQGKLRQATAVHARLVEQHTAEAAAVEEFDRAEKAAGKRIAAMGKEAAAEREKVKAAFAAAQAALVGLVDAVAARNAVVDGHATELVELGLALAEGDEHANGARRGAAQLAGEWWLPVDAGALLTLVAERVSLTRVRSKYAAGVELGRLVKVLGLQQRSDVDVEAVEAPPLAFEGRAPLAPSAPAVEGAPVGLSEFRREGERKDREIKYTEVHFGQGN